MGFELDELFHPRSIAIVGASPDHEKQGYKYLQQHLELKFSGPLYPVNPRGEDVLGLRGYSSVLQIPGPVDYVISTIPAAATLQLVEECETKGVKAIHFYTARFSETGRAELADLENRLRERARRAGIRIIGPNCMGIYYPKEGMTFKFSTVRDPGNVGVLSQSGGNAVEVIFGGTQRGVRFSKVVSYGNALDLNEADFTDYFAEDPETSVIGAYIEGVKDGPRFLQALRKAASQKPVVILKGGRTPAGTRAVASHTASLAGPQHLWQALAKQTGALLAKDIDEMVDMLTAFAFCPPACGYRVGVVGGGGGRTVQSADECEEAGLQVIPLPQEMREQFRKLDQLVSDWINNPADGSIIQTGPLTLERILTSMAEDPHFDLLIANVGEQWPLEHPDGVPRTTAMVDSYIRIAKQSSKPFALVLGSYVGLSPWQREALQRLKEKITDAGIAHFPSIGRAAQALSRLVYYHRYRREEE